ncbi:MAG: putative glycosyl hydrolase domain [Gemmatimonadetes bacterium]|nr:putative glycosyl hydrolase domain [Gemmatimonadota bacterium]
MHLTSRSLSIAFVVLASCTASGERKPGDSAATLRSDSVAARALSSTPSQGATAATPQGQPAAPTPGVIGTDPVRALYVNRFAAQSRKKMHKLIALADSTEINALVIDMKDEFGLNYAPANADWARNAGHGGTVRDLKGMLDTLKAHGILPIARLVVFKDSVTARVHPEWTIRKPDGTAWRDKKGLAWVNPYHRELWEYNIGVAEELVKLGFGEIQFDYIRFPEPYKSLPPQVFQGADVPKPVALQQFLSLAKKRLNALGVRSTADIFGLVTTVRGALEVGQDWEKVSPAVDVVLPMTYPSHYPPGSFNLPHPNAEPYKVILTAVQSAATRDAALGIKSPEHVRPWLQAFTLGAPAYGVEQLLAQKKAVYDAGYDGWVLWSPGSQYDIFRGALEAKFESRKKK